MDGAAYLADVRREYRRLKDLADRALAQVSDDDLFHVPDPVSNSLAVIIKHMSGNMRSRWRDFLTSDGEKPDRHRDMEFVIVESDTAETLLTGWEQGWDHALGALDSLEPPDLARSVSIRGESHTVMQAIQRQLSHYASHVGQIVQTARSRAGESWQPLTIPLGKSEEFNQNPTGYIELPRLESAANGA